MTSRCSRSGFSAMVMPSCKIKAVSRRVSVFPSMALELYVVSMMNSSCRRLSSDWFSGGQIVQTIFQRIDFRKERIHSEAPFKSFLVSNLTMMLSKN